MMNEIIWKGISKGVTTYLDSERNPTMDYLIRSLRINAPLEPKNNKQNVIKKIMQKKPVNPITRGEVLVDLKIVDDPRRVIPLMYYYSWSKTDLNNVKIWKTKYLYDIELPIDEELRTYPVNVDLIIDKLN